MKRHFDTRSRRVQLSLANVNASRARARARGRGRRGGGTGACPHEGQEIKIRSRRRRRRRRRRKHRFLLVPLWHFATPRVNPPPRTRARFMPHKRRRRGLFITPEELADKLT